LNRRLTYSVIALALLIAHYLGLTQIQISEEQGFAFLQLVFVGYFFLGVVFGFFFAEKVLIGFALVFALGFLGSLFSVVIYYGLLGFDVLIQNVVGSASLFVASIFFGVTTAAGTLVKALLAGVWRRWFK
jgi:hypothetical protein